MSLSQSAGNVDGKVEEGSPVVTVSLLSQFARRDGRMLRANDLEDLSCQLSQISDHFFVKDLDLRFALASQQVANDHGFTTGEDLLGKSLSDLIGDEAAEQTSKVELEVIASKVPRFDFEETYQRSDGRRRWLTSSILPYFTGEGDIAGVIGVGRDVTDNKNAATVLEAQNEVLHDLAQGLAVSHVLQTLVKAVEQRFDAACVKVMVASERGTCLKDSSLRGCASQFLSADRQIPVGPISPPCGAAAFFRQDVYVEDICKDANWSQHAGMFAGLGVTAVWSLPFFGADKSVLGTLDLCFSQARLPTGSEQAVLHDFGQLAAFAVERGQKSRVSQTFSNHDALTGLLNRQGFEQALRELLCEAKDVGEPVAVVVLELDNFRDINEGYGHATGDAVLKAVAKRISKHTGQRYVTARTSGDEFAIILVGDAALKVELREFVARLHKDVSERVCLSSERIRITCSAGSACFPQDTQDIDHLLKLAEREVLETKSLGGDDYRIHNDCENAPSVNRLALLEEMETGLAGGEFVLLYQPQVNLKTGAIVGAEALVRWQHPTLGMLLPDAFIELAEKSGLIVPMGRWVLYEACRQARAWQDEGLAPITIAVNVSARQFRDAELINDVCSVLDKTQLPADKLELEVTENLLIQDTALAVSTMEGFRRLGLKLAIDDFGTGYSGLTALKTYPLTRLKIDKSFVAELDFDTGDRHIVTAMLQLARDLGLEVVAEGVETVEQGSFLAESLCTTVQGFLYGAPMTGDQFGQLLRRKLSETD